MFENQNNNKKCHIFMKIRPLIGRHIRIGGRLHVNQPLENQPTVTSLSKNDANGHIMMTCSPYRRISRRKTLVHNRRISSFLNEGSLAGESKLQTLDFKDTAAPRFGHSAVVFCLFLVTNIKSYRLSIISRNA